MNEKEKKLFQELCKFKNTDLNTELVSHASAAVLGNLFFNRMQGVAYDVLKRCGMLGKVNREFKNALAYAYEQNAIKNKSFFECISMLSSAISKLDFKVALLKGAYLCAYYPEGYRTSNDIDILIKPENVSKMGNLLQSMGFNQGHIRNGCFEPASRREIIESKMMRGETVPYIKEVSLPYMKYLEVDINFSLDYKNSESDIVSELLERACRKDINGISISTLEDSDFFLHLCAHLYKEATTLPWIKMKRDMTLYKYMDIYMLISEMSNENILKVFERSKELGLEQICAYAISEAAEIFDIKTSFAYKLASEILVKAADFKLTVISPTEKKLFIYEEADAFKRFTMDDRITNLREIKNEKT